MFLLRTGIGVFALISLLVPRLWAQPEKPEADPKQAMQKLLARAEDEYRRFFKRPEKAHEFWAAMKFEMNLGKFDLAALHLQLLLEKQPAEEVDRELLKIEEVEGLAAFVRFQAVKKWSDIPSFQKESEKNVETLINRISTALEKHLSDPVRIGKLIQHLDAPSVEERAYAFMHLSRCRVRAAPYLIKALQDNMEQPLYRKVVEALLRLDRDIVPGFLEALKARDVKEAAAPDLRLTLIDIIQARADQRAVPYLWHLSSAPRYPAVVRARAKAALAYLLEEDPDKLPLSALALTRLAEDYYRHRIKFADPKRVTVWPWDGRNIAAKPTFLTARQAEEYFGLRHAREALDLDPSYQPAQIIFLKLLLEHNYAPELEGVFLQKMPAGLQNLLAAIDSNVLLAVLEEALQDNNVRVAVAALGALGERGEVWAARLSPAGAPQGIVKALHYPDRRVQYAAALAMLRMPTSPVPVASHRVVEILRRFLAANPDPKALVLFIPPDKARDVRTAVKATGFEPVLVGNIKDAFEHLHRAADIDAILLFPKAPAGELPYILSQLRSDPDCGRLPLLVFAGKKQEEQLVKMAGRFPSTWVVPEILATLAEELKTALEKHIQDSAGAKLSAQERQKFRKLALDYFWRMARGEIQGHDIRPAREAIVQTLNSKDLAVEAIEILGRLPGADNQQRLADVVLDPVRGKLRQTAALELNRHIQKNSVTLPPGQIKDLRAVYRNTKEDNDLRGQIALVLGSLRPGARQTGVRLLEFQPGSPPPAPKQEKE